MRPLPYDDPGQPDVSSPARFLLWTGRQQIPTLLLGVVYGVIWMVAQALVPAAIGRGLQTGVADGDLSAAAEWSLVVLGLALVQAVFGILRHRVAVANWLAASFRAMQLLGRHSSLVGVAIRRRLPTGEIVAAATNDALRLGGAFDVTARLAGAIVSYAVVAVLLLRTSVLLGLIVLIGVPAMVLLLGPLLRPLQRRQHVQREVAGQLTALGADTVAGLRVLRGIGGEPAFLHRYRTRSRELEQAGVHVASPQATLDAAQVLLPSIFLVLVTWLSARLALEGTIDVGDVVAFYGYAFFLVIPIRTAVEAADKMTRALVGAKRIVAVLVTEPEIPVPTQPADEPPYRVPLSDPRSGLHVTPGTMVGLVSGDPDESAAVAHAARPAGRRRPGHPRRHPAGRPADGHGAPPGAGVRGGAAAVHRRAARGARPVVRDRRRRRAARGPGRGLGRRRARGPARGPGRAGRRGRPRLLRRPARSGSPWRGRCSPTATSWCSSSRPARSTRTPR